MYKGIKNSKYRGKKPHQLGSKRKLKEWKEKERNTCCSKDPIPGNILQSSDKTLLCSTLLEYIAETRKTNGELYIPKMLQMICVAC